MGEDFRENRISLFKDSQKCKFWEKYFKVFKGEKLNKS